MDSWEADILYIYIHIEASIEPVKEDNKLIIEGKTTHTHIKLNRENNCVA